MRNRPITSGPADITGERIHFSGRLIFYELPEPWTDEEYRRYWFTMSRRERERYIVHEAKNLLTNSGRSQLLAFAGASGTTSAFAQQVAFGTTATVVSAGDASVQGEIYRSAPASATVSGNQVDISLTLPSGSANGTLTNAGIFGINATGTAGSGTLMTHALLNNFVKNNGTAYNVDYVITLT